MMRHTAIAGALVLALLCGAGGRAQGERPTVVGREIRNLGPGPVDEGLVFAHTSVMPGEELDPAAVARDVRALLDSDRFSHVSVEAEPAADGVRLVYVVRRKLELDGRVRVEGAARFSARRIRKLLAFDRGGAVDEQALGVAAAKVREAYAKRGLNDVGLSWETEVTNEEFGLASVTLYVDEGLPQRLRRVTFSGNTAISDRVLKKSLRLRAPWNPIGWFQKTRVSDLEVEAARSEMREAYLDRGYLDVTVGPASFAEDGDGNVTLGFAIEEGAPYRLGRVRVTGVTAFPVSEIERLVRAESGEVASLSRVRGWAGAVSDFYESRGYVDVRVRPALTQDADDRTVDVALQVSEGGPVHVRNILIRGNTRTREKVIRRELLVYPGDRYDGVKARTSERRISNLGFFSNVRRYTVDTPLADRKDLVFEVEEQRTGQFMVGAGFSSIEQIMGFVELSQGNFDLKGWPHFTGGGQKLRLRAQFGTRRRAYELSFVEPWFLDRKLSLGLDLYRNEVDYRDYDVRRTGGAVTLGKALPGANRISFRYRLEDVEIWDVADTNRYVYLDNPDEAYFFNREEDTLESSLTVTLTHDRRDNAFIPTRGVRATLFGRLSGGPLGCDTDTYGLGARAVGYVPLWFGHVFRLRGRYEVVDAYGDEDEVPISDRLFIGGGRTIRGFDYRDVGPKVVRVAEGVDGPVVISYRPVGGRTLALATASYTIPIVKGIRFALFYDIGNVWRDVYETSFENLASGAGVGLRLDLPGFPVRIDRAWVIEKDDNLTDEDAWVIWIGYDP